MKVTIETLRQAKANRQKFSVVSCYDYTSAKLVAAAGVDVLLVGDSASQFMLGFDSTLPVTMDFMLAITAAVRRAAPDLLLVADMPYAGCRNGTAETVINAERFAKQAGADIVKIETAESDIETIKAVISSGIPVMPHLGIRPQTGKYKAEGATADVAAEIIKLAEQMYKAGAEMLLLEGTAREAAKIITEKLPIPVISCGSGPDCNGQVLILPDILNLKDGPVPKFSKSFADIGKASIDAIASYDRQIKQGTFPDDSHSYHMKSGEYEKLKRLIS
ncbi:MAG: 3-methyl-2-oxobutanoate hydroxymethyltransferase [Planctomycetes bacterium]|nr:3-methyl-2-oxobutanoate hydroxymethyltransferase [Planctomycetota bacterium]MBU1517360.1 3-methyl-2-oxobutanoate hydroxymethyltransferase [Planctomycetota bacterium]MBU2457681.1 3-methyl-2-oxobutanoate hydroxymethyltransferase [Planctomycetota bacterium]MBU2596018.1 3-methyl-2-oxobutanoate hydroxymethyltransferase [Planctomycetota bacterium]